MGFFLPSVLDFFSKNGLGRQGLLTLLKQAAMNGFCCCEACSAFVTLSRSLFKVDSCRRWISELRQQVKERFYQMFIFTNVIQ